MHCPRRTSELCTDPGSSVKRASRSTQRTVAPSPANAKFATRQTRIPSTVRARSTSMDRAGTSTGATFSHATRGQTPRQTPHKPTPLKRDDKKWISEQVEKVTNYLEGAIMRGELSSDVLAHSLRQMTIKNFVVIVNHFLHKIGGNRLKVGSNYVDELINILHKLEYPNAINKSWLKTPNTPHSFSNVMLLFEYFMEFVPTNLEQQFDLLEPTVTITNASSTNILNQTQMLDVETQRELWLHAKQGFQLWDKQQTEEYDKMKQQTCNLLIEKRCGLSNINALRLDLEKLNKKLKSLQTKKTRRSKDNATLCVDLKNEVENLEREVQAKIDAADIEIQKLQSFSNEEKSIKDEIIKQEVEIEQTRRMLEQQLMSAQERNKLITKMDELQHMLNCQERSMQQVQQRSNSQQVRLSRSKKQLNDKIEKLNSEIRKVAYIFDIANTEHLLIPLIIQNTTTLQPLKEKFKQFAQIVQAQQSKFTADLQQLQEQINQLNFKFDADWKPKRSTLLFSLQEQQEALQKQQTISAKDLSDLDAEWREMFELSHALHLKSTDYKQTVKQKRAELQQLSQENERLMDNSEREHLECAKARKEFLRKYDIKLKQLMSGLGQLELQMQESDKKVNELVEQLNVLDQSIEEAQTQAKTA